MIEGGILVGFGLLFIMAKLSWRWKMRLISNPVLVDIVVFAALTMLHWGTFTGVMVATIGAMVCSVVLSVARKLYGHVESGKYYPGVFNVVEELRK